MSDPPAPAPDQSHFRVLGYYFSLSCESQTLFEYVHRVLGAFAVPADANEARIPPTPNVPPRYNLAAEGGDGDDRYTLLYGTEPLLTDVDAATALNHLFWHVNNEAVRRTGSFFLVHAGAVATPAGEALLLPSESGGGKSTLVAALVRAGFSYLSDEAAAIDPVSTRVHPFPKALTLKAGAVPLFPDLAARPLVGEQLHLPPDELRAGSLGRPAKPRWVVQVRYRAGAEARMETTSPGQTTIALGRHALNMRLYGGRALPLLAEIGREVEGYSLEYDALDEAVAILQRVTCSERHAGDSD